MTRFAVSYGVPFGDLVNIATGLAPPPQTAAEWRSLGISVATDAVGGKVLKTGCKLSAKAMKLLVKLYMKCGGDKAINKAVNYAAATVPVVLAKGARGGDRGNKSRWLHFH